MTPLRFLFVPVLLAFALGAPAAAVASVTVGGSAPDFTLTDLDGRPHRLSEYRGKTVVLEWTNPTCPIVGKHYRSGNIPSLQRAATADGVVWLSINSGYAGSWGDFAPAKAADWLRSHGAAPTAYLRDPDGSVGRLYGATATPDMFIVAGDGMLVYEGAIDSIPSSDESDIPRAVNYVRAALASMKAGQPISVATSRPYGCAIKY